MAMMTEQKESFRRYLEASGVVDALTTVLVKLYEEPDRPRGAAVDYVKAALGGPTPSEHAAVAAERDALRRELDDARAALAQLQARLAEATAAGAAAGSSEGGPGGAGGGDEQQQQQVVSAS